MAPPFVTGFEGVYLFWGYQGLVVDQIIQKFSSLVHLVNCYNAWQTKSISKSLSSPKQILKADISSVIVVQTPAHLVKSWNQILFATSNGFHPAADLNFSSRHITNTSKCDIWCCKRYVTGNSFVPRVKIWGLKQIDFFRGRYHLCN